MAWGLWVKDSEKCRATWRRRTASEAITAPAEMLQEPTQPVICFYLPPGTSALGGQVQLRSTRKRKSLRAEGQLLG